MGKKIKGSKEKTREQKQEELDMEKRNTWENFKKLDYDKMDKTERESVARHLYETMSTRLPAEPTTLSYNFWDEYKNTDEIKEINRYVKNVDDVLSQVKKAQNPSKESWLDKDRGIIPQMKREWKTKLDPFKSERHLREKISKKANDFFNLPENKNKDIIIDIANEMQKAIENIEEKVYKPVRAKIDKIEEEIKKKAK